MFERIKENQLIIWGHVSPMANDKIHQQGWVYDIGGLCPALCARDFKDPKRIIVKYKRGKDV